MQIALFTAVLFLIFNTGLGLQFINVLTIFIAFLHHLLTSSCSKANVCPGENNFVTDGTTVEARDLPYSC